MENKTLEKIIEVLTSYIEKLELDKYFLELQLKSLKEKLDVNERAKEEKINA